MLEAEQTVNYTALSALEAVLGLEFPALVRDFRKQTTDSLLKLEEALSLRDCAQIKSIAHTLKGSALSLHCKPMADSCAILERTTQVTDFITLDDAVEELREVAHETLQAIERWTG